MLLRFCHKFYFVITMSKAKTGEKKQKSKGSLEERIFYQCYCSRNYLSYSALYLHVKNKHQQNLSFRHFCRRKTYWSGSIKNIVLEFDEDADEKRTVPLSLKLRERKRKTMKKEASDDEVKQQAEGHPVKIQEEDEIAQGRNIANIFLLYCRIGETQQIRLFRSSLLDKFVEFINRHHHKYLSKNYKVKKNFCTENGCEQVPILCQHFFQQECSASPISQPILFQLLTLCSWLQINCFTSQKIVNQSLEPCKIEEFDKVKIEKTFNDQF